MEGSGWSSSAEGKRGGTPCQAHRTNSAACLPRPRACLPAGRHERRRQAAGHAACPPHLREAVQQRVAWHAYVIEPALPVVHAQQPLLGPVVGHPHARHQAAVVVAQAHHKHVRPLPLAVHGQLWAGRQAGGRAAGGEDAAHP